MTKFDTLYKQIIKESSDPVDAWNWKSEHSLTMNKTLEQAGLKKGVGVGTKNNPFVADTWSDINAVTDVLRDYAKVTGQLVYYKHNNSRPRPSARETKTRASSRVD